MLHYCKNIFFTCIVGNVCENFTNIVFCSSVIIGDCRSVQQMAVLSATILESVTSSRDGLEGIKASLGLFFRASKSIKSILSIEKVKRSRGRTVN